MVCYGIFRSGQLASRNLQIPREVGILRFLRKLVNIYRAFCPVGCTDLLKHVQIHVTEKSGTASGQGTSPPGENT